MAELKGNIEANNTPVIVTLNGIGARGEKGKDGRDGKDGSDYIITSADYAEIASLVPQYDDTELREEIADLAENKADKSEIPTEGTFSLIESRTLDATATEAVFRFAERYNGVLATVLFPSNISGTYYATFGATSGVAGTAGNVSGQNAVRVQCFNFHGMWKAEGEGGASSGVANNWGAVSTNNFRAVGTGSGEFPSIGYFRLYTFSSPSIPAGTQIKVYGYK